MAERKNRHLFECNRALLFQQNVQKSYWGEAVLTSEYVTNKIPFRVFGTNSNITSEESVEEKEEDSQTFDQFRFDHVYARRRNPMATTRQERFTEPSPGNEVTILEHNSTPILDHNLPIALRKGTRECTKRSLYPLSHFVAHQFFMSFLPMDA